MTLLNLEHLSIGKVIYFLILFIGLNLLDYPNVVRNPMDLGTIARKCRDDKYIYAEEVLDDIQLIWDNCKLYNPPQTVLY
jgi:hypothetical protein